MIGIAEKGYATLKVTASAPGGHSSMPPVETGVGTLARAITAIADKPFPLALQGPGAAMLETLAAEKGGTTKMAVANQWLFGPILKREVAATPSTAPDDPAPRPTSDKTAQDQPGCEHRACCLAATTASGKKS